MTESYFLERAVWTDADFDSMGWHDATIHAIAFLPDTSELALDLDYILEWVEPSPSREASSFWVAPATFIFENAFEAEIQLHPLLDVTVQGLERRDPQPTRPGFAGPITAWQWLMDCNEGSITLRATGFRQIFRRAPIRVDRQSLLPAERGEVSLGQAPFKAPTL